VRWRASPSRAGDPPVLVASAAKANDQLGWVARRISLEGMVRDAAAWMERELVLQG
jgi:UDP-glucose 4-epimerase